MPTVRVFVACSLDGFIAGPGADLSWLPDPDPGGEDYGYRAFMRETSAILMGRNTYDVAATFDTWPYGETPVYVATSRALKPRQPTVTVVSGTAREILANVRGRTDGPIYLDGGRLIRSFADEDLIDELTITFVPVILGQGEPLFAGTTKRHRLRLVSATPYGNGLVQLRFLPLAIEDRPMIGR
jgi:dihydrofolate reductase